VAQPTLIVAAATRPYPGETANGDAWTVQWHDGVCRIAVIDGLGHGPQAAAAAQRAVETLVAQPHLGPAVALQTCHRALAGSRGAAMAVVAVEPGAARLTFAGVGNVEAQLWDGETPQRPVSYRGIVGSALPTIREFQLALAPDGLLLLHTDGISARFDASRLPEFAHRQPQTLADAILARAARPTDDATIVVARLA
jgi:serine/threonine protein phosphatase PrpC